MAKSYCFVWLALLIQLFLVDVSGQSVFSKLLKQPGTGSYISSSTTPEGGVVVASINSTASGDYLNLVKVAPSGAIAWAKKYSPSTALAVPSSLAIGDDGEISLILLDSINMNHVQLWRFHSDGSIKWTRTFPAQFYTLHAPPLITVNVNCWLAFSKQDTVVLLKVSPAGQVLSTTNFYQPASSGILQPSALVYDQGSLFIGGYHSISYTSMVIKADTLGNIDWQKTDIGDISATVNMTIPVTGGSLIVSSVGENSSRILSVSRAGTVHWAKRIAYRHAKMVALEPNRIVLSSYSNGGIKIMQIDTLGTVLSGLSMNDPLFTEYFRITSGGWVSSVCAEGVIIAKTDFTVGTCRVGETPAMLSDLRVPQPLQLVTASASTTSGTINLTMQTVTVDDSVICGVSLPVRLLRFRVLRNAGTLYSSWEVAGEQGVRFYELEESVNGRGFRAIGRVSANGGSKYGYTTNDIGLEKARWYRLKILYTDGQVEYSHAVLLKENNQPGIIIRCEPGSNEISIAFEPVPNEAIVVEVMDMNGRIIVKRRCLPATEISVPVATAGGVYAVRITSSNYRVAKLVTVQ